MVARDRVAVEALRLAIGAVENAEARPVDDLPGATWSALEDAPATAEVARRHVSEQEALSIVRAEVDELDEAAASARHLGRPDAAERASQQAGALRSVLATISVVDGA